MRPPRFLPLRSLGRGDGARAAGRLGYEARRPLPRPHDMTITAPWVRSPAARAPSPRTLPNRGYSVNVPGNTQSSSAVIVT